MNELSTLQQLAEGGDIALGLLTIVAAVAVVWLKTRPARAPAPPNQPNPANVPAPPRQEEHPAPSNKVVNTNVTCFCVGRNK